jgi:hypothetical protein
MTSQATNRREGVSMSFCGCSQKLRAFTYKELETVRAVKNCLVRRLLAGGVPGQGVVVEVVKEVK